MGKGMDPEMMASLRDHLNNIEHDIESNKEEFDKFKLNYLNDIQSIVTKAPKTMVQEVDERMERRFKLLMKDLSLKDKRIDRVRRDVRALTNEDSKEGYTSDKQNS